MSRTRIAVGAVLAVVVLAAGLVGYQALSARSALLEARSEVTAAVGALGRGEVDEARGSLSAAGEAVATARERTDGPLWAVGRRMPLAGRSLAVVREVVELTDAAVALADTAVERAGPLLAGGLTVEVADGRVDLAALEQARDALADVDASEVVTAREELAAVPVSWVPATVRSARSEALGLADRALGTLERAEAALEVLPSLLGADTERRLLVGVQTNAELRATGGLIGFVTVLSVDDGRFELSPPVVYEAIDQSGGEDGKEVVVEGFGGGGVAPGLDQEFLDRYRRFSGGVLLSATNLDPDLPTTAEVFVSLYEDRTGQQVDGVVMLDPVALEYLLSAIGDVPIPEAGRTDPAVPEVIPADEVAEWAMIDVYDAMGQGRHEDRLPFLQAFGTSMFAQVFGSSWDGVAVARQVGRATGERHLQVWSEDEREQELLTLLGVGGVFGARGDGDDLLAVTANNAVGGKMDVHLAHRMSGTVSLREDDGGWVRRAAVRTEVENPLPASGRDIYIIGNCDISLPPGERCFNGEPGVNRTWFTVWGPEDTSLVRSVDGDGESRSVQTGAIHGHRAYDVLYLETPPESSAAFEIAVDAPVELDAEGPDRIYRLTLWRQAKAIPDHWDLSIEAPEGWSIASAEVDGGGAGQGMGVGGDGSPVSLAIDGGAVRVSGAATQDVHVQVRFTRSVWDRVKGWLGRPLF